MSESGFSLEQELEWESLGAEEPRAAGASRPPCSVCAAGTLPGAAYCDNCGWPLDRLGHAIPDGRFPKRFEVRGFLGRGASGRVFLCRDTVLGRDVAVKVLSRELAGDPEAIRLLRREAAAAMRLRGCEGILEIHSFEIREGVSYLASEYARGGSLRSLLRRETRLREERCRQIGARVARALDEAHRRDVVHRDIKPGNILLGEDGLPRIADFGIAKLAEWTQTTTGSAWAGTPAYVAPEVVLGSGIDARADLYSLGCMLFEMATGELPYKGSYPEIALAKISDASPVPDPAALRPEISAEFAAIVRRLLARDPSARFASGAACADALLAPPAGAPGMRPGHAPAAHEQDGGIDALREAADRAIEAGRLRRAEALLLEARRRRARLLGGNDLRVARDTRALARCIHLQGRHRDAARVFRKAMDMRQKSLGALHPDMSSDWMLLAELHGLAGAPGKAARCHDEALRILRQSLGPGHPALLRPMVRLAACRLGLGEVADAEATVRTALDIAQRFKGRSHPLVARILNTAALVHLRKGEIDRCEVALSRALAILELAYGADSPALVETWEILALAAERRGNHAYVARLRYRIAKLRGEERG